MNKKIKDQVIRQLEAAAEQSIHAGKGWHDPFGDGPSEDSKPVPFSLDEKMEVMEEILDIIKIVRNTYTDDDLEDATSEATL